MSISEKDAVLRERIAFRRGVDWHICHAFGGADPARAAREWYVLPKLVEPRVVYDTQWAGCWMAKLNQEIDKMTIYWQENAGDPWTEEHPCCVTRERVAIWADLLANPTQEVEDDA